MTMIRLRNNSESVRTLPAVGDANGKIKGPLDRITIAPGCTADVDSERLKLYDSPAFNAAFDERDGNLRPELEILGPAASSRSLGDLLAQYDEKNPGEATEPVVRTNGGEIASIGGASTSATAAVQ